MKKLKKLLLFAIVLSVLLAGCSSGNSASDKSSDMSSESYSDTEVAEIADSEYDGTLAEGEGDSGSETLAGESSLEIDPDKIIYSANATVETKDYNSCIDAVNNLVNEFGGFVESSSITGITTSDQYYNYAPLRTAYYTIRIPNSKFSSLGTALDSIGNVTEYSTQADNVTSEYTDLQSRLSTYTTQRERLMSMLEHAESVEEMLKIEDRLTEVIYQIESITAAINNLDSKVSYSTLSLYITEVRELTDTTTEEIGYWEDVASAFTSSIKNIVAFAKDALKFLIASLPYIVIILVIGAVVFLIWHRIRHRKSFSASRNVEDNISRNEIQQKDNSDNE